MNYKVMQRPMFKMGGKAASQGTGITSGLDEKVNMSDGRANYANGPNLSGMSIEDLMNLRQQNYDKSMSGIQDMRDIVRLQTLGNLATNVLPNIEGRGLSGVVDFFQDPMTTQGAIKGLTGLKQVDLKEKQLQGKGLDRLISGKIDLEKLDIARDRAAVLTATQVKVNSGNKAREILRNAGVTSPNDLTDPILRDQYDELKNIADGTATSSQKREIATKIATNLVAKDAQENGIPIERALEKNLEATIQSVLKGLSGGNAYGGMPNRVDRAMGTPEMGEQPMMNPMAVEQQDVAMETQDQGNDAYAMLRARLPQEIPDDVVKLIAYNKDAFADFASIKNQQDVSSFNQKYGVSMNIDVSTV